MLHRGNDGHAGRVTGLLAAGRALADLAAANRVYVLSDDLDAIEADGVRRESADELLTLREALARSAAQEMASRTRGVALGR